MENVNKKPRMLMGLISSIAFTLLGIYLYATKSQTIGPEYETITKIVGALCVIFFGIGAIIILVKMIKQKSIL